MSMAEVTDAIYRSSVSQAIQNHDWVVPTVQSIHILAIAAVIGSALMIDLKVVGVLARSESSAIVLRRYIPWVWWGLTVLLLTGLVMVVGEPERVLGNPIFWTKMGLVLLAATLTWIIRTPLLRAALTDGPLLWKRMGRILGALSLAVWILVIFCGRWIAYLQ